MKLIINTNRCDPKGKATVSRLRIMKYCLRNVGIAIFFIKKYKPTYVRHNYDFMISNEIYYCNLIKLLTQKNTKLNGVKLKFKLLPGKYIFFYFYEKPTH